MISGQPKVKSTKIATNKDQFLCSTNTMDVSDIDCEMPKELMVMNGSVTEVNSIMTDAMDTTAKLYKDTREPERNSLLHCGQMQVTPFL